MRTPSAPGSPGWAAHSIAPVAAYSSPLGRSCRCAREIAEQAAARAAKADVNPRRRLAMNPVVHFEMPYENPKRISDFYAKAFGWKMQSFGEGGYVVATTTETGANG